MSVNPSIRVGAFLTICLLGFVSKVSAADYLLDVGDKLSVSVFRQPNLDGVERIDIDGRIHLPLIGEINATNETTSSLAAAIAKVLIGKGFLLEPNVTVSLVELRPFYIDGDIVKSGPHPFEGNLTLRRAVAIAGGYDLIRLKVDNPLLMAADLRSQDQTLWADYARSEARILDIQARLDGKRTLDLSAMKDLPVSPALMRKIVETELQQFTKDVDLGGQRQAHLERSLIYAREEEALLGAGQKQDASASSMQDQSVARMRQLVDKGVTTLPRLEEEERQAATLRNRLTDTQARLAKAHGTAETARTELEQNSTSEKLALSRELQRIIVERSKLNIQISGVEQKMLYTTAINSQLENGARMKPSLSIYRQVDGRFTWIEADENTRVQPGDVIDVAFSKKQLMGVVN